MKNILSLIMISLIMFAGYASARNIYDSTGRKLLRDDSIRARHNSSQVSTTGKFKYNDTIRSRHISKKAQAKNQKANVAAAAKIDYENLEGENNSKLKSNYIQSKNGYVRELRPSVLKSNYIQSKK